MIVGDTNVLSELAKTKPDQNVLGWLARFAVVVGLPTIVLEEVHFGVLSETDPARRAGLAAFLERIESEFAARLIAYDAAAARATARLRTDMQAEGTPIAARDAQIAGVALSRRVPLATRDRVFRRVPNLTVLNPWTAE